MLTPVDVFIAESSSDLASADDVFLTIEMVSRDYEQDSIVQVPPVLSPGQPVFLTDHAEIHAWLAKYMCIMGTYSILDNNQVRVIGSVGFNELHSCNLSQLAVDFLEVTGDFTFNGDNRFTTLMGCPQTVGGHFKLGYAPFLKSLYFAPAEVGGNFTCVNCDQLTSLRGAPHTVGGNFKIEGCSNLTSLKGCPVTVKGRFVLDRNHLLNSLDGFTYTGSEFQFDRLAKPTPAHARRLFSAPFTIKTNQLAPWVTYLKQVQASGDFLGMVEQFNTYFGEPFHVTISDNLDPVDVLDLPKL